MTGAIIIIVAYGIQDLYLTGDPQITLFKILYRRHTNFAIESVPLNFTSTANFGETVSTIFPRQGDLVERVYLYAQIPAIPLFINQDTGEVDKIKKMAWVRSLGFALIQEVSIEIGGKQIDKQYGEWLYVWSQLTNRQDPGLDKMIGNISTVYQFSNGKKGYELYVPLAFWLNRHTGLALPLISLSSSDVKLTIVFRRWEECLRVGPTHSLEIMENVCPFLPGDYIEQVINNQPIYGYFMDFDYLQKKIYYIKIQSPAALRKNFESPLAPNSQDYRIYQSMSRQSVTPKPGTREVVENTSLVYQPKLVNAYLYINYVYLDKEERLRFTRSSLEYLIEQIQFNQEIGIRSPNVKQKLNLLHPCKAHYWVGQLDSLVGPGTINDLFNFTSSHIRFPDGSFYGENLVTNATLLLNGKERFSERSGKYFNEVQPYQHYHRGPAIGINVYSFCLHPELHQPSGTMNMSEVATVNMMMRLKNVVNPQNTVRIRSYTVNYNILRILSGLGGLAFD